MNEATVFLNELIGHIDRHDKLHSKKINRNVNSLIEKYPVQFNELLLLVYNYFKGLHIAPESIAADYLKMIADMRKEGLYFYKYGKYRCESQAIAYENVYSRKEIMSYYMHALLVSQILWKHHFNIFMYFQSQLKTLFASKKELSILDVGPGHGFFSFLVQKEFPGYKKIDIVDISETSLQMTERIIGYDENKISYTKKDIFDYDDSVKYDFIVLGEVIEHLDDPKSILIKLSNMLNEGGLLWVTTPTNSPALDHVYLFHTRADVVSLLHDAGLQVAAMYNCFAEDMDEATAIKNKVTDLVGIFCKN